MPGDRGKVEALREVIGSPLGPLVLQTHPPLVLRSLVPDAIAATTRPLK